MKILRKKEELCTGCGKCMEVCSSRVQFRKLDPAPERSAIQISKKDGVYEINVCNQCGTCIIDCPVEALTRNKMGVVLVNKKTCVGCFTCVGFCPTLSMRGYGDVVYPFKCIACGKCVEVCKPGALYIEET